MCGIVGVLNLATDEPFDLERLRRANETLIHRGPDEAGIWAGPGVALAMRRLSIIDVARGHQPLGNEDGTIRIVYNGEVYNHGALREELRAAGHRFQTECDTEVIVHAYEQWGTEGCLRRLRGMFAFALWDSSSRTLLLARDRMGIKPLYIAEAGGRFFFASEIRPILVASGMPRRVHFEALPEYMDVGFITSQRTMFEDLRKLPPAHYLLAGRGATSLRRYWSHSYETANALSAREQVDRFRDMLAGAVSMSLMSEVPLGALLSGGIDSAVNVALMQRTSGRRATTVSVGFDAPGFDESALTVATARALGTDHHLIRFTGDSLEDYPAALAFREEPAADTVLIALYKLFQACRQEGLTVVLTGEGADELLGGYYWHRADAFLRPFLRLPRPLRTIAAFPFRRRDEAGLRMARILRRKTPTTARRYMDWIGVDPLGQAGTLLSPQARGFLKGRDGDLLAEAWSGHLAEAADGAPLHQMLWLESRTRLTDRITLSLDRMSMAHSVEARPPFLDHLLWEFCSTVPAAMKLRGPYGLATEKHLLREAARGLIPEEVRLRKKKGLAVPYGRWFSRPRLPEWAETALSPQRITQAGMFDPASVSRLRREHRSGAPGGTMLLVTILSLQLWEQMFISRPLEHVGTLP